ncbi:hypothetical protein B6I21_07775 [candidate division KSB1 bacterium 4572_119]|nr:MAG: hypothetical protein B6I21_07775 [candidate division KSB1 bacterium 4572_119]
MKIRLLLMLIIIAILSGCSAFFKTRQTYQINLSAHPQVLEAVGQHAANKHSYLYLENNQKISFEHIWIVRDNISIVPAGQFQIANFSPAEVKKIVISNPTRGRWEGAKLGALIGIPIGLAVTFSDSSNEKYSTPKRIGLGIFTGSIIGSLCGGTAGEFIGFKEEFIIK